MEELRDKLANMINEEGPLSESVLKVSEELDALIVAHYKIRFQQYEQEVIFI